MPTFVLSDNNSLNTYGFKVRTEGISLARFRANPVMLDDHWNSTRSVLGQWENIRVENGQLKADTLFDDADPDVAKIKGKVERGFLKGASVGITFKRDDMQLQPDGSYLLAKCELLEASIVAIPSNANAVRLYAADGGQLLAENEIKLALKELVHTPINHKKNEMEKVLLTAAAMVALAASAQEADIADVNAGIERLATERDALKASLKTLTDKAIAEAESRAKALVAQAVTEGKLTADVAPDFETMAMNNYDMAAKVIGVMPGKKSLAALVTGTTGATADVKTIDDFEKLPFDKQLAFKNDQPEAYKALFA